ncbi:hypothetical protein ACFLXA_02910 [Chloroflexota bacterium]
MAEDLEKEGRVDIDGVPARILMGVDDDGEKRILRCDKDGFLICKVVSLDREEIED